VTRREDDGPRRASDFEAPCATDPASPAPSHEPPGSRVDVEWTVEGRRGRVAGTVVELPFLDLDRKRA
jgi:hypothetical protein